MTAFAQFPYFIQTTAIIPPMMLLIAMASQTPIEPMFKTKAIKYLEARACREVQFHLILKIAYSLWKILKSSKKKENYFIVLEG
jgi:hypothetical protein